MKRLALLVGLLASPAPWSSQGQALAGSVTSTLQITVQAPLQIVFTPPNPTVICSATPGTVVAALSVTGGDGNAPTWAISGDTTDFALSGSNIVIAAGGITAAGCPVAPALTKLDNVVVTATQS
jgi:hypothetical protein